MTRKLLLFDIDGTLLLSHGTGRRTIQAALAGLLGRPIRIDGIAFSGRTDQAILTDVLRLNGVPEADLPGLLPEALDRYAATFHETLDPGTIEVLPGVPELLHALAELPTIQLALVTGNLEQTAYQKLAAAGLDAFFPFGSFGSDDADRDRLPPIAVERALAYTSYAYSGKNVVIIGDTEHDIRCGRGLGTLAVAVCTGTYCREDLAVHNPDILLDDLRDTLHFVQHIALSYS